MAIFLLFRLMEHRSNARNYWSDARKRIIGQNKIIASFLEPRIFSESEGGVGIHFPHILFSSRAARAVWDFVPFSGT